jgi:serine/threonine protein kinase
MKSDSADLVPTTEVLMTDDPTERQPPAEAPTLPPRDADGDPGLTLDHSATRIDNALPQLADYELLGELGRGGMGVVYKARHRMLNRLAAVKVLLSGAHAGAKEHSRFRTEAAAIAQLQHPNIVQIFEVGEANGVPFFALEYVAGGSLADRLDGTPQPERDAAKLVEQLARAMHFAHSQGVVHRDLKPANVLLSLVHGPSSLVQSPDAVEGPPRTKDQGLRTTPKITDFGLAKLLDTSSGPTQTGAVLGTPSYMAPEQAGGETRAVGPACDVYALGAILYELLTGRPPFKAETPLDTVLQVLQTEPVPPSRLRPKLARDLETVCLKCLRKEPAKRYASAEALADDLRRFLDGEPIQARPVGVIERGWRWGRRHPSAVVALASLALVVLAGFALVYNQWRQAEHEKQVVQAERDEADHQRERAHAYLVKAMEAADRLTRVSEDKLGGVPQLQGERRQIVEDAVKFYESLMEQESDDPLLRRQAAHARVRAGKLNTQLGQFEAAEKDYREALRLFTRLVADYPARAEYCNDQAAAYRGLALVYRSAGDDDRAAGPFREALARSEQLVREHPGEPAYLRTQAETKMYWGLSLFRRFDFAGTEQALRGSEAAARAAVRLRPDDPALRAVLAEACNTLGFYFLNLDRPAQAEASLAEALGVYDRLVRDDPAHRRDHQAGLSRSRLNLGVAYARLNRPAEAEKLLNLGLASHTRLADEYPEISSNRYYLASGYFALAQVEYQRAKYADAERAARQAATLTERLVREHPKQTYYGYQLRPSYFLLGLIGLSRGDPKLAQEGFDKSVGALEKAGGKDAPFYIVRELTNYHAQRGQLLSKLGRDAEALPDFDRAVELAPGSLPPGAPVAASGVANLKVLRLCALARTGRYAEAVEAVAREGDAKATGGDEYNRACVFALSAAAAAQDETLPASERASRAERFAAEAVARLRRSAELGHFKPAGRVQHLKDDHDLDALRDRADYRELLRSLEARQ